MTPTTFANLWNASATLSEAAAALGKTPHQASVRASQHRQAGTRLKRFGMQAPVYGARATASAVQRFYAAKEGAVSHAQPVVKAVHVLSARELLYRAVPEGRLGEVPEWEMHCMESIAAQWLADGCCVCAKWDALLMHPYIYVIDPP